MSKTIHNPDYEEVFWTAEAMMKHGGSFVQCLGKALRHADRINQHKIIFGWPEYYAKYKEIGKKIEKETYDD
jgi:hypothetical protein